MTIKFRDKVVTVVEVDGQTVTIKAEHCFENGRTVMVVPVNALSDDKGGDEVEVKVRQIRAKQHSEHYKND